MKKHTLQEHLRNLYEWDADNGHTLLHQQQLTWFIAYERWLNDRPLMTEEDKVVQHAS